MNQVVVGIILVVFGLIFGLMAAGTYVEVNSSIVKRPTYSFIRHFSLGRNEPFAIPSTGLIALLLIAMGFACTIGLIDLPPNNGQ